MSFLIILSPFCLQIPALMCSTCLVIDQDSSNKQNRPITRFKQGDIEMKSTQLELLLILCISVCAVVLSFGIKYHSISAFKLRGHRSYGPGHASLSMVMSRLPYSGKMVVTGVGKTDEDEFLLTLLNEQVQNILLNSLPINFVICCLLPLISTPKNSWSSIVLATEDATVTKKKFLSRTARYSGLLNVLEFSTVDMANCTDISSLLSEADAWIAFDVPESEMTTYASSALQSTLKRVIFTTTLEKSRINSTDIPYLTTTKESFKDKNILFTAIRHGEIIEGDEDHPYEIVNATSPCPVPTVERGVLARVASELLQIDSSNDQIVGLSSSGEFSKAYLSVLRSSGLTRSEEVKKMLTGGLQRIERTVTNSYEIEKNKAEQKKVLSEERKAADEALALLEKNDEDLALAKAEDDADDEYKITETEEQKLAKRTEEILQNVWKEYQVRMYAKSTSKMVFFDSNRPMAKELAEKEFMELSSKSSDFAKEDSERQAVLDRIVDSNRKQYSKLLALEKKELQSQKEISDTWVKYIYTLLEVTMDTCKKDSVLFHNLDEYSQTIMLRGVANGLRKQCNLPPYEVIYDPLDASAIVGQLSNEKQGIELGLQEPIDDIVKKLNTKYGSLLKSISALRGASQIIEAAIDTLKAELPSSPPSINELRRAESSSKQQLVSQARLDSIRNRGKPSKESDESVGRF